MYEYGNARIAALRGRLLDGASLRRLADADSIPALLVLLERAEDWRGILREVASLAGDPQGALEAGIERHRSGRLGALPGWYPPPSRGLVEALVIHLDAERVIALLRRRHAGESPEAIGSTIVGGAILEPAQLGSIARTPSLEAAILMLTRAQLVGRRDAAALRGLLEAREPWEQFEAALVEALDRARIVRAEGRAAEAALVRAILDREHADRLAAWDELAQTGASAAALAERSATLARLDDLARLGRRDPLGIGAVAGYVAAVEAQAIRLRAVMARVAAGWSGELVGTYLAAGRI